MGGDGDDEGAKKSDPKVRKEELIRELWTRLE